MSPAQCALLALLTALAALSAACASADEFAGRSALPTRIEGGAALPAPVTLSAPAAGQMAKPAATVDDTGAEATPSAASDSGRIVHRAGRIVVEKSALTTGETASVEDVLEKGFRVAGASPVHLAIRGTPDSDSVRCAWRGVARTEAQREDAIRFWLQLAPTDPMRDVAYLEILFSVFLDTLDPRFRETAKANFLAIARGGESMDYVFLTCFADYAVTSFLLGTGTTPASVTVAYDRMDEAASYDLYVREHDTETYGDAALQTRGDYEAGLQAQVVAAEAALSAGDFATTRVTAVAGLEYYHRNALKAYADISPGVEGPRLHAAWATSRWRNGQW